MEQFSVLKTPAYPKYHGSLLQPHYSDRFGYKISYYEPLYDLELKIPGLGIAEVPFIPIQRSNRTSRPFVPRCLTEQDMIQINLRAERKAKDIMKDFHPSQKASYESAKDFRIKKEIESRMEEIRESCANVHNYYRKAEKYDFTRKKLYDERSKSRIVAKNSFDDLILNSKAENVKDIRKKLLEDKDNHRAKFRLHSAGCAKDKEVTSIEAEISKDQDKEETAETQTKLSSRRSSRETRSEQLKSLQEKIKKQETESDCFERTFGRHLAKLRGEINSLTYLADDFIADSRYQSFKVDQIFRRN